MDAVTYPDEMVAGLINDSLIPLRVPHNDKPLSVDFNVQWTPSIMILDVDGREHHRTLGFLAPEEFIPSLLLGVAKSHLDRGELEDADRILDKLLFDFPRSDSSPEALYLFGVTKYKISHDASVLKDVYERLVAEYPGSVWTKRAHPYSLL